MTLTIGYLQLRSDDDLVMVQIFTDLTTGSIRLARVMTRKTKHSFWEPLTEVKKAA